MSRGATVVLEYEGIRNDVKHAHIYRYVNASRGGIYQYSAPSQGVVCFTIFGSQRDERTYH